MKTKKINFKKLISYLLIFTVFFTIVQMENVKEASATEETQVTGLIFHVASLTGEEKIIDKNSSGEYVCEYLPIGESFVLESESGYKITSVTSSNSTKMKITRSTVTDGYTYAITSITDYSDFTLTVVIENTTTNTSVTYPIEISFESDSSLEFSTLRVTFDDEDVHDIDYTTTDEDGYYTLDDIDSSVSEAAIELFDSTSTSMTCTVNDSSSNVVSLVAGENTITVTVTSLGVSKDYILIITKKGEAKLSKLVPSTGTLSPTFDSDTEDYEITVATTQTTIAFTPTSVDTSSTIKVDGSTVESGSKSDSIDLDEGENEIDVVVKTDSESKTYTIVVTRTEATRSSQLTSLKLTSGTLSPTFNSGIYKYTATVANTVNSIGIKPVAEDTTATITIDGDEVPSGATSTYISLDEGTNVINVIVTDTNDDSETYVLTITRKYTESNSNLSSLSVTDGTMSPVFDPDTYLYSVEVDRSVEKVKINFTGENDGITIEIDDTEYTSGQESDYIKLDLGANLVKVLVTAEDGKSTATYTLSIIRGDIEATNQWVLVSGEWTFYNAVGTQIKNQWVKYDNEWYFLDLNGNRQEGWIFESDKWYYLNDDGIMQTGWFYDKGYWYYLQADGSMRTDYWATYDAKWYYFNSFGEVQTGWKLYKGKYYYMNDKGEMQTGWITYDKNKFYLNDDGSMRIGWLYNGKVWFYLDSSGKMLRGWQTIDGKRYYFDTNGAMKTGMMFLDGQWINLNNA
jgi:glucan-binding YG repeat protein